MSEQQVREEAAAEVRRLIHGLVGHHGSETTMAEVARVAAGLADRLEAAPRRVRPEAQLLRYPDPVAEGGELGCWPDCMVAGEAHPTGTGLRCRRRGDEAVGVVTLGPAHEGLPGRAHGGILASLFDEMMGFALWMDVIPAYTAWLRVEYRQPVQLGEPLELRAGVTGRERRKMLLAGSAHCRGELVAEATGLFVVPREYADAADTADTAEGRAS